MLARSRFDRGMRSQFCDRVIAIGMRSPFISYHRDADGYSSERFYSSSPYREREGVRREDQGLLLMKTSDARWKSRSIRFPIRAAVSGMAQEITLQPFSRDEPAIFILFSRTFGLSTRVYTPPPSSPFCYFEARCACKG